MMQLVPMPVAMVGGASRQDACVVLGAFAVGGVLAGMALQGRRSRVRVAFTQCEEIRTKHGHST